jgi:hypothetical protein
MGNRRPIIKQMEYSARIDQANGVLAYTTPGSGDCYVYRNIT